jgi:hypothetical protein
MSKEPSPATTNEASTGAPPSGGTTEEYREGSEAWRSWRRGLIAAEREEIVALRDRGEVSAEAMRRVERDLDLEESRLGG